MLVLIWLKLYRLASKSGFSKLPLIHSWVFYVNNNNYLIRWIERLAKPARILRKLFHIDNRIRLVYLFRTL